MPAIDLSGKTALVTGGARGIGRAIVRALAKAGADVAFNYRKPGSPSEKPGNALVEEIEAMGRKALVTPADIAKKDEVNHLVTEALDAFGRLDILILNAARAPFKPFHRLLERDLRGLVEVNLLGNVFLLQRVLEPLSETQGRAVFISSLGSRFYHAEYSLGWMKAAMENVIMSWAQAYAGRGVNLNAVCAGIVKTDSFRVLRLLWPEVNTIPEEAFVPPEDVADVVLFLCSALARSIRGQTIVVDRGMSNALLHGKKESARVTSEHREEDS